jgi:hypothetical protein
MKKVLLLGSSHGRGLRERLHSILRDENMVTNIFKPNATVNYCVISHVLENITLTALFKA